MYENTWKLLINYQMNLNYSDIKNKYERKERKTFVIQFHNLFLSKVSYYYLNSYLFCHLEKNLKVS